MQYVNLKEAKKVKNLFYKLFLEKTEDTKLQFFRYLFVGGFAAVVNIGSLFIFKELLNIHYLIANIIGFILGLITNYILSKWLVFSKENDLNPVLEFITYAIIGVLGLGFDTLFMWLFTSIAGLYYMLSKIISTGLVFIWNFIFLSVSFAYRSICFPAGNGIPSFTPIRSISCPALISSVPPIIELSKLYPLYLVFNISVVPPDK